MKTTRRNFFKNALAGVGGAIALLFAGKTPDKEKKSVFLKPVRIKPGPAELPELDGTWSWVGSKPIQINLPPKVADDCKITIPSVEVQDIRGEYEKSYTVRAIKAYRDEAAWRAMYEHMSSLSAFAKNDYSHGAKYIASAKEWAKIARSADESIKKLS